MEQLLTLKTQIYRFIGKYEIYVMAAVRFVIAIVAFRLINSATGYSDLLTNYPVAVIFALICCFLPAGLMIFFAAVLILIQFYAVSSMLCLIVGLFLVILFCVFLRFSDRKGIYTMLTPILAHFGIPYVMPVACGFFDPPFAVISVICGEAVYFILRHAVELSASFASVTGTDVVPILPQAVMDMAVDKEMYLYLAGFAVTAIVVFGIRKLAVKYAHYIAVVVGAVVEMIFISVGEIRFLNNHSGTLRIIIGCLVSLLIMLAVCFMTRDMDYKKIESLQFEDDEYYYYVRAVPKTFAPRTGKRARNTGSRPGSAREIEDHSEQDDEEERRLAETVRAEMQSTGREDAVERK